MSFDFQADRRTFLQASALAGVGYWVTGSLQAAESKSSLEKVQVACVGVGGKGKSDVQNMSRHGKIFALCDVDSKFLKGMAKAYKTDHTFVDYREMLDQMGDRIDAVVISVPDHNHAVIASKAMKMGKHVHCQKPLTRTIWEARRLGEIARENGVATQMGNQFTAFNPMRKAAAQIKAGQLGTVKEVHVWTNRPIWPQGERRPMIEAPPKSLDWNVWLGPAQYRPYGDGYHPFSWRGWWDFGTGALGDMACHTCNLPFMALNMRDPISVEAECPEHDGDSFPNRSKIKFEFPELAGRAPFTLHWYDGGNIPSAELFSGVTLNTKDDEGKEVPPPYKSGCLIVGDAAKMYAAGDYADLGVQIVGDVKELNPEYPISPGHEKEWFIAMSDPKQPAMSNFPDYSGPLVETILLGNLAIWKRGRVEWDPKNLKPNDPALEKIVHCEYRDGYQV